MARNQYADDLMTFDAWKARNPDDPMDAAAIRMRNSLWAAAHNNDPPPTMAEDAAGFVASQRNHQN